MDLKAFISHQDSTCDECHEHLGSIGRSASAKSFDENAIRLAVVAHIRHAETKYDELLSRGMERWDASDNVQSQVDERVSEN